MLIEQIRKDILKAKKEKDFKKSALLSTLLSEAEKIGKDDGNRQTTDAEFIKVVKKFLNNIHETVTSLSVHDDRLFNLNMERSIIEKYLPKQLYENELRSIIENICIALPDRTPKAMGKVMAALKLEYDGLYDGKMASQIVKECLED